jgi:hypothetical protein
MLDIAKIATIIAAVIFNLICPLPPHMLNERGRYRQFGISMSVRLKQKVSRDCCGTVFSRSA